MSNPTLQSPKRPASQRTAQQRRRAKTQRSGATFRKQTARLEGRRDGTPLIFGWGGHLTRAQKTRIQQNAAYGFLGAVTVVVIGVFLFGLLQQLVLIPNATVVKVNDVSVAQDTYRKMLAYNSQDLWNQLQANIKKHDALNDKIAKGDNSVSNDLTIVTNTIQVEEGNYSQSNLTQNTIDQITEDQLIQQATARFAQQDKTASAKLTPKAADIDKAFNTFKSAVPAPEKYSDFLAKNGMSDSDVKAAVALQMRRDLMQSYLAAQLTSPMRQVHLRHIEASTQDAAQKALAQMQKDKLLASADTNWGDFAKKNSLDPDNKDKGGDLGWVVLGTGDAGIELWAYDPARKVGDWKLIKTAGGTFDIVQVVGIDPHRSVDATTLKNTQDNILPHWLGGERVAPFNTISTPDPDMLQDTRNIPKLPDLNAQLPKYGQAPPGTPGGMPLPGMPGLPPAS